MSDFKVSVRSRGESSVQELLSLKQVSFRWPRQSRDLFHIPEFSLKRGERVFLRGPSGSGKSTLLNLIGGVLPPTQGEIEFEGRSYSSLSSSQKDALRSDQMGFVFQMFNLIPFLTVAENISLPCRFSAARLKRATEQRSLGEEVERLLDSLALNEPGIAKRRADELSVGQQQRVACARALIGEPSLVIADEPTSALDSDTKEMFIRLLLSESQRCSAAVLFVSHDPSLASFFSRSLQMADFQKEVTP